MVSEIVVANPVLQLMPVICMVDILLIENPRLQINQIYRAQISKSGLIAFSKCDLLKDTAERERLINQFKSNFPEKQDFIIQPESLFDKIFDIEKLVLILSKNLSIIRSKGFIQTKTGFYFSRKIDE